MDLHSEIDNMFAEIENYCGDFGDPIATEFSFNPYKEIKGDNLDSKSIIGIGVAYIVNFSVYIDNNDYEAALQSSHSNEIECAIEQGYFSEYHPIENALKSALISEDYFNEAVYSVYINYIRKSELNT